MVGAIDSHQQMGYDRAITMFSPDGRLLQVEYAKKTVRLGNSALGIVCKDGVVLVADKRITDKLTVPASVEKIYQIDDHIAATVSGLVSDGRILMERSQTKAQQHRVSYDNPIQTLDIVKDICDLKQVCTQSGGLRPFGVSLLLAGIDSDGAKLFLTEPSGIFFQYKATAVGEKSEELIEILQKQYKDTLVIEQGIKLAVNALKDVLGEEFKQERLEACVIRTKDKSYEKLSDAKLKEMSA